MLRNSAVVFIVLATICQCQGNNPLQEGYKKIEDLTYKVKEEAQLLEKALGPSVARFDITMKKGIPAGQKGVRGVYNRALEQLKNAPVECTQGVKENLLQLQSSADKTFLSCSNLTMAVQDLGNLVTFSGNMLLGVSKSIQELTWFTNCFSWNPVKSLPCFFQWIGLIFQGTKGLISSVSTFNSQLDSTLLNMLQIIEYCQARTVSQHDVVSIMEPVHQCAKQPIPHHLYTL